jgi:hypothetical protein
MPKGSAVLIQWKVRCGEWVASYGDGARKTALSDRKISITEEVRKDSIHQHEPTLEDEEKNFPFLDAQEFLERAA